MVLLQHDAQGSLEMQKGGSSAERGRADVGFVFTKVKSKIKWGKPLTSCSSALITFLSAPKNMDFYSGIYATSWLTQEIYKDTERERALWCLPLAAAVQAVLGIVHLECVCVSNLNGYGCIFL